MKNENLSSNKKNNAGGAEEKGSAIVIAMLVLVLLMAFVALAVSRTTSETISSANDAAESRTFEAANASLEVMTNNFKKIFDWGKLNPEPADLDNIRMQVPPDFDDYEFEQDIQQTQNSKQVVMTGGDFQGLSSTRDEWQVSTIARHKLTGVEVELKRRFYNDRIPIFQFGIFYNDNLEFHPGPKFDFGGRVHSNANLFLMANTGLWFTSKVTAHGEIFTDTGRNGEYIWSDAVHIKLANGTFRQLKKADGSVLKNGATGPVHTPKPWDEADLPPVRVNTNWETIQKLFQGNLKSNQSSLDLPIVKSPGFYYIDMIKRGKEVGDLASFDTNGDGVLDQIAVPVNTTNKDPEAAKKERYYNKPGIRVSLADSKAKLPGCVDPSTGAAVTTPCGVLLNGNADGSKPSSWDINSTAYGYDPGIAGNKMTDYRATRLNGNRFYVDTNREVWIKVETVGIDTTNGNVTTQDITKEMLSLGVTERAPQFNDSPSDANKFFIEVDGKNQLYGANTAPENEQVDNRSVIKLQRFIFGNRDVPTPTGYLENTLNRSGNRYNYVVARRGNTTAPNSTVINNGRWFDMTNGDPFNSGSPGNFHLHRAMVLNDAASGNTNRTWVVPFPINMFDAREGVYDASQNMTSLYPSSRVPWNGVMSLVDIDVANLRRVLNGEFDGKFPSGTPFAAAAGHTLTASDIPQSNGWVVYLSDRRGDVDFDGQYDMEDILGNNGILDPGKAEDVNGNNILEKDYFNGFNKPEGFEGAKYHGTAFVPFTPSWNTTDVNPAIAAVFDHRFYRRAFRLINGEVLPGRYDAATPANTKGFTVASENGVYVLGNYNATNIVGSSNPTPPEDYRPYNTANHIPASIAADAITILSNRWNDGQSFRTPFTSQTAAETTVRFAMISGDARSSFKYSVNQGGGDPNLTGGVHNFKRFLENWSGIKMNYAGSIINLYNAQNNNGSFKNDSKVYNPPNRNWVFDSSFLDPNRLPPGTPFFQTIQLTGFQRLN